MIYDFRFTIFTSSNLSKRGELAPLNPPKRGKLLSFGQLRMRQWQLAPTLTQRKFPSFGGVRGGLSFGGVRGCFIFLLLTQFLSIGYSNNKEYYENLLESSRKEIDNQNYAKYAKTMENLMQIKVYAKEYKFYDMQVNALNAMGILYKDMLSYDKAIECYLEAYQMASKLPDKKYEIGPLNNIGQLYYLNNNIDKASEYFDRAYDIAVARKDNFAVMQLLCNQVVVSNQKGNLKQSEKYLLIAMKKIKQLPENPYIGHIKGVKAEYLYLKKEYRLAEQLVLEVSNQNMGLDPILETECMFLLSKIYHQKKNYSQAISYAKDALRNSLDILKTIEIYTHLSTLYRATHSSSFAMQYQDSAMIMKDSLLQLNGMNQILRGQIQFELNNLEKEMAETKAKQKRNQLVLVFIIVFTITLFLLILYIRSIKNKQLKEQQRLALLELKMSENEIEQKNKQLVSKTLFQLSKNELMEEIIHTLSHIPKQSEIPELHTVIQKLKAQMKEPANTDWNSFLTYFEQSNPAFLAVLKKKHPALSTKDIRLSSYIYLNLDTKEISKLLNITPDHCKKKKRYLAQKLGIPTMEIYRYLAGIG